MFSQIEALHVTSQQEIEDEYQAYCNEITKEFIKSQKIHEESLTALSFFWIYGKASINSEETNNVFDASYKVAVKIDNLPDGRIRYYDSERPARKPGPTRGSAFVTEYNPKTGQVRQWNESYDHAGNINRIHPKTLDGQDVRAQHSPPTKSELEKFSKKPGGPT